VNFKWQEGAPAPVEGSFHTSVLLDGKVYIGGGKEPIGPSYRIDVYTLANNSWNPSPIITPVHWFAMTTLNNQLIIAGGKDRSNKVTNNIFLLDGCQLKEYTRMIIPRYFTTATGHKGTLIIIGGNSDQYKILATTELFDSTTGQWYDAMDLPVPHYALHSVIVDNTVFLLRGSNKEGMSPAVLSASLDTLSSHQLSWSSLVVTPWYNSTPVSIKSRYLLILGGYMRNSGYTNNIYIFNKVSYSWEIIGKIPSAISTPAAVSIDDNEIVVVGGLDKGKKTNPVWIGSIESQ